jgi:hypothetical protein
MHSDWFNGIEVLQGDGSMEKKWDTVILADLKRLFVSGTYMSRWSRKGSDMSIACSIKKTMRYFP